VKEGAAANPTNLALGVEHLKRAIDYARRGRRDFFDKEDSVLAVAVEAELRKAFESLNRLGQSFWIANPDIKRYRIQELRQLLTHDYTDATREVVWDVATDEAPRVLRRLEKAKVPTAE
jgi:uncharacterized protein with HEPN domain